VVGPPAASRTPEQTDPSEVSRSVRFAGYLIGVVIVLVYGVTDLVESIGQIANCSAQTVVCRSGFSTNVTDIALPTAFTGVILLVIAILLFRAGERYR
jgi:hypothetical protein